MNMDLYAALAIATAAICTFATRAVPFVLFGGKKEVPKAVSHLGNILPPAVIAVFIIYCLRNINPLSGSRGIPEIAAVLFTAFIHILKGNTLLSIGGGTLFYMALMQYVF